jgi:hypothetical protein
MRSGITWAGDDMSHGSWFRFVAHTTSAFTGFSTWLLST